MIPAALRAVAFDLKAFFTVTGKEPVEATERLATNRRSCRWRLEVLDEIECKAGRAWAAAGIDAPC